jgi:hypothetical protein
VSVKRFGNNVEQRDRFLQVLCYKSYSRSELAKRPFQRGNISYLKTQPLVSIWEWFLIGFIDKMEKRFLRLNEHKPGTPSAC